MPVKHYDAATFVSSQSLGYLVKLSHTLMHDRANEALAGHDVTFIQWIALRKVAEGAASNASDLCRSMCHDTGALTRMVDQLEARGYMQRVRSQLDRRVVELQVTPAGQRMIDELTPIVVDRLNEALADFSAAEFAELVRLLRKLIDRIQDAPSARADASGALS